MTIKSLQIFLLTFCISFSFVQTTNAQTQAEIEAMQNESSSKKEKLSKDAKKIKKDAEKAERDLEKANANVAKEADKANKATVKIEKDIDKTSVKKVKTEKVAPTAKVEKTKVKKEKPAKVKKSGTSSRMTNSMNKPLKTWSIDLGINATNPQTDIRYHDFIGTIDPKNEFQYGGQLRVTKMFDNAIGLQMKFSYNRLQGVFDTLVPYSEDRNFMQRAGITEGLYFKNNVIQGSFNLYWNISNTVFNINRYYRALSAKKPIKKRIFSLYAYSGLGITVSDPHVMRLSDNRSVSDPSVIPGVSFQTARTTELVVPVAMGVKLKLSKTFDLGLEAAYNFLFSDKLDGFNYDHPGRVKNDGYTTASMVLTMKLGNKKNAKEHIEWANPMEPVFNELAKIGKLEKKVKSLAKDEDEDGVSDFFDKDTDTPEGTTVGADGRVLDMDRDGVIDDNDMELFSGNNTEVDENGRAIDTDHDGVPDYLDKEDGTSKGEMVNFEGRTVKIPAKNETENNNEGKLRNLALPSIFFDTDKSNIKREYEDELFQMALTIKRNNGLKFILEGHCDERGSDEHNIALGKRRSEAVKQYLVENYKLDPSIFTIVSKGRAEMLSPRFNINRRVDIIIAE